MMQRISKYCWFLYILLFSFSLIATNISDVYVSRAPANPIKKSLYVDGRFARWEIESIHNAAEQWTYETGGLVEFEFVSSMKIEPDTVIIFKKNHEEEEVQSVDIEIKGNSLGYYSKNTNIIAVVYDRIYSIDLYEEVVMHELGHALGLGHNSIPGTLMYPDTSYGITTIGPLDVHRFCEMYNFKKEDCGLN